MESYHHAWLSAHPERSKEWLATQLSHGFHVHHLDGDHSNDDPTNLVLLEGLDHFRSLHGATRLTRLTKLKTNGRRQPNAITPPLPLISPVELTAWRNRLGLNKSEAASTLGLARNTYNAYENGGQRIPLYVALACAAIAQGIPPIE